MTGENAEPLEGWALPPRCCGDWRRDRDCPICGTTIPPVPPNIVLGGWGE